MPWCAIAGCTNNEKVSKSKDISFHRFPKDSALSKTWLNACKRVDKFSILNARICSSHFEPDDFVRDLKGELLNRKFQKLLKPTAVPHVNIPNISNSSDLERSARAKKRDSKKLVKSLVEDSFIINNNEENHSHEKDNVCGFSNENCLNEQSISASNLKYHSSMNDLLLELEHLKEENLDLKKKNENLLKELETIKIENIKIQHLLGKYESLFSSCQKKVIISGKCNNWEAEDISTAVTLRYLSFKAFNYVRDVLKFPLPCDMTIKRRLKQFTITPGFISLSFNILKSQANILTDSEKDVVLCFDEMKVKSDLCYDFIEDVILGPCTNVQVLMIRSLMGNWKQPIFYNFDQAVDKNLLYTAIEMIECAGFKVRAFVSDLGPSNQKLLSELGITIENTAIINPFQAERKIWAFCDVPHMLKLMRNHLLDKGYQLSNGNFIEKEVFEKLINNQSKDLKYAHKISLNHLLVRGTERQNVRKAAELLSDTVASAIEYLYPTENGDVISFIRTVNSGFDILNSRIPIHPNKNKSGYGNYLNEQNEALDKFKTLCSSMRVIGRKSLLPFQKGFLVSINSIKGLYEDLKNEGYSYILSARCNQDVLESYFSQLRGLGKFYDHPLPTAVTHRIKTLLFSKNASAVIKNKNCSDEDCTILSAKIIEGESDVDDLKNSLQTQSEDEEFATATDIDGVNDANNKVQLNGFAVQQDVNENDDLLKMLAGYIAYRVRKKNINTNFNYGYPTNEMPSERPDWLSTISRGYLTRPSNEWFNIFRKMEKDFIQFHGLNGFNKQHKVMETLANKLKAKYEEIDDFAITCYVRTRTFIRIKSINKVRSLKRKSYGNKHIDTSRKTHKKLSKLQQ